MTAKHDAVPAPAPRTGRVLRISGGVYQVDAGGDPVDASLRGRVKRKDDRTVSVGDLVEIEEIEDAVRISRVLPRTSALTRHGIARRREQVIVANVDQIIVTAACVSPAPDLLMIDRLLALAELNSITACVVANKIELVEDSTVPEELQPYLDVGYEVLRTSAVSGEGVDRLADRLAGRVSVLTGQSGVGKSSLLNALIPGLDLRIAEVGGARGRGRHTTVAAALYPFPGGGYVADTPGLQYLSLWEVDPSEVGGGFVEIAALADGCRFSDCRHRSEPGCEVRAAVALGEVRERRYESYLGLLEEAEGKRCRQS